MRSFFALALASLTLAGCSGSGPIGTDPAVTLLQSETMPEPTRSDLLAATRPYLIGPFDKLRVDVFGIDELSNKAVQADASGRFSFPLVGVVEASGKTPGELASLLESRLRGRYVRDPQVTVNLLETVSQVITVDGQVGRPGLYPVVGKMTLMRAVATAGGTTEFAKLDNVIIFRTVDAKQYAGLYNLKAIRMGNYSDPEVFANDVVVVSDSQGKRLFKDLLGASNLLTTPLIVLTRN